MVRKLALLAAGAVVVCSMAPRAEATWPAAWGVKRWYRHYAARAPYETGRDWASTMGHHGWGSYPKHWGWAIAYSARPWPPMLDYYFDNGPDNAWTYWGWGDPGWAHHGRRHHRLRGFHRGHRFGHHSPHGYHYAHGYHHYPYGYHGAWWGYRGWCPSVYGAGVGGMIYEGQVVPPAEGPGRSYDPNVPRGKDGELIEPPMKKSAAPPTTKLLLNVPADARVILAGVDTRSSGPTREFVTTLLNDSPWTDYTIRVELDRDGNKLVEERSVTLNPGDVQELTFDFTAPVASEN